MMGSSMGNMTVGAVAMGNMSVGVVVVVYERYSWIV